MNSKENVVSKRELKDIQAAVVAVDDVLNKLAVFDKISSESELDEAMPGLLASLGRYAIADRAYLFTWTSTNQQILQMTHEWCEEGVLPTIGEMQEVKLSDMPNWTPRLKRGEAIIFSDWDAQKENMPEEYAIFDGQNIHSLIIIPIFANKKLNGYIGFDNPEQSRVALSVRLLSSIGGHISSLKDNFFMMEELQKKQEKLKNSLDEVENALQIANLNSEIIGAISKLYWLIYRMDLVNGTYEEISAGQEMHSLTGKCGNTEEVFKEARETIVSLEYQEKMKIFLDTSTLSSRLRNRESISTEYRATSGSWHLARFIVKRCDLSGKVLNVLYVVRQIDKEKQTEIEYEEKLSKHNLILSGLSVDYTIAFVVNLDTDDYEIVFNQKTNHAQIEKDIAKFSNYVARYTEKYVLPEYRIAMRQELSSITIAEKFKTRNDYHFSFETVSNAAGLSCFQAHIVKQYEGEHHYAFLGFRSVDEIVKKERFYKQALQKANKALKKQLDLITASIPGGVKISNDDETYSFKYVSEQFANMLGYATADELIEASDGSIFGLAHPDDLEVGLADALDQYSRADHYATTYRMKCKDGSWKYIEDRGNKIRTSNGTIEHWNLILDNDELMQKTIELEIEKKSNQNKLDFLSRMSHDMRTPLNGIIGLLDICKKHPDDRQLVDSSRLKARVAAEHLLSLINDTLEFSKLENNNAFLYEETFHIATVLHEVETIAQLRADEEQITIFYDSDVNSLPHQYLIGSPLYVKQILLNLITNAIKYNKKGGSVYCFVKEKDIFNEQLTLEFIIRDTGIGMKKEFLKNIFKPFEQADHGPRTTYMGTGLGMPIVKNLLGRMNGTIQIDSIEGEGTTVNIVIPFKIASSEELVSQEPQKRSQTEHDNLRVLLVEDNELNREIATFVLEDEGMKVIEATDGQQAVSMFLKEPAYYFDIILMDIMMPVMDGYEATKAIRSCRKTDAKTIPIIAMTANAFDGDIKRCLEVGMNAHLAKPLEIDKVIDTIIKFGR